MTENVLIGMCVMVLCLLIQSVLVAASVLFYTRHRGAVPANAFLHTLALVSCVMLVLVIGNFLQVSTWALLFMYLGEFDSYGLAAYHSAVNFSTLGYGDIVMSEEHRVLGPMQALNGVLMVGVSTAVIMFTLQDALRKAYAAVEGDL